jgi:hypothetical protein
VHVQLGSLVPEPFLQVADSPDWQVTLQSFPASFLALHELLAPAEVLAPISAGFGVLLGPQADNTTASSATESFMVSISFSRKKTLHRQASASASSISE